MQWFKQSTAASLIVGPILDSTGIEYASAVIGDLSLSKNGGTLTALASAATLTYIANGYYTLALTTGNTDTLGRGEISCNKATYQMPPRELMVLPATVYDALVTNATTAVGGLGDIQRMAGTALTARDIGASVLLSSGTGTGQVKLSSGYVAPNWGDVGNPTTTVSLTGTTIASTQKVDVDTIKTNPVVNGGTVTFPSNATLASTTNITAGTITTASAVTAVSTGGITRASLAADTGLQSARSNTAQAGGSASITLDASASSTTDYYKGLLIYLTGGTGVGQGRLVTAYNGTTKVATIAPAWATNPDNTSTFAIMDSAGSDIQLWVGSTPNALISGRVDANTQATASSLTFNLTGNVSGSVGSVTSGVTVTTNNDKTGYSLTQSFPSNFASLAITAGGIVQADVQTIKTQTVTCSAGVTVGAFVGHATAALTVNASGFVTLADASLTTAKLGTFALAKTTNITGFNDLSAAQVNSEVDTAISDVGLTTTITGRIDAAVSSRMATYTQPTGFLTATFPSTVASTTNITAGTITTVTNLTNLPTIPADWLTAAGTAADFGTEVGAAVLSALGTGSWATSLAPAATALSTAQWTNTRAGYLDNINNAALATTAAQTGDAYARLGAPAGVSVSADVAAVKTDTGNLVSRITSTLFSGITSLAQWLGLLAGKQTGDTTARTELRATGVGSGAYSETTDSLEALRDRGDAAWVTATGFSTHSAADVWAVGTRVLTAGTNIVLAKGIGVTGFNDLSAAQVNTEVDTAIGDVGLTTTVTGRIDVAVSSRLAGASYTAPLDAAGTRTAVGLGAANLDTQLNSIYTVAGLVQAKTDNLPAAPASEANVTAVRIVTDNLSTAIELDGSVYRFTANALELAPTGGSLTAADVWSYSTRILTAGTNIVLAKGTGVTGFNDLSAAQINAETDTALADVGLTTTITGRIDAAITTRLASGTYTAPLDAAGTRVAVGLAAANLDTQLAAKQATFTAATGVTFPSNFGSLGINGSGHVSRVTLVDTTTTNTDVVSAAAIADAVWDEALTGHTTVGTAGKTLITAGGGGSSGGMTTETVLLTITTPSNQLIDSDDNQLTEITVGQALTALLVALVGDRTGVGTREITASLPGIPGATVTASRVDRANITSAIVVPAEE